MGYRKELKELMAHILLIEKILCINFNINNETASELLDIYREHINKKW